MYKIMTKLHTARENVFAFHMVNTDANDEELVEYAVQSQEEAKNTALKLLGMVGYEDLRIVDDKSYYLNLIWGEKPVPEENKYNLVFVDPEGYEADPLYHFYIPEGATVKSLIVFNQGLKGPDSFHLIVDGKEYKTGLPKWIRYEAIDEASGYMYFDGITKDHTIEIMIDDLLPEILPGKINYLGGLSDSDIKLVRNTLTITEGNIEWYDIDETVGRLEAGNRFGIRINAPEHMEFNEYRDAKITINMYHENDSENDTDVDDYIIATRELTFEEAMDDEKYFDYWPLVSNDLRMIKVEIQWSDIDKQIIRMFIGEDVNLLAPSEDVVPEEDAAI